MYTYPSMKISNKIKKKHADHEQPKILLLVEQK